MAQHQLSPLNPSVVTLFPGLCDLGQILILLSLGFFVCKWNNANEAGPSEMPGSFSLSGESLGLGVEGGNRP